MMLEDMMLKAITGKKIAFWVILHAVLSSAEFFQDQIFRKVLSGKPSECQIDWIQTRPDIFVGPDQGPNCLQKLSADDS